MKRIISAILCLCCLAGLCGTAAAAQVDCDAAYCFTGRDFSQQQLQGICVTGLPAPETGTVMLGSRVIRPGDILDSYALEQLTFQPLRRETDAQAQVTYLPIYEDRVETEAVLTIAIRGKEDKAPVAEDSALETYKNLPTEGKLKVSEPEGETMTYTLLRAPRRGQVQLMADGSFVYTPKKNKVGVDSFTFTATDPAGNVSREATVTVQILKPTDSRQYTDTVGRSCRFEAEWLRNTGLFVGETLGGDSYFQPDKTVSRGEFLAMVVRLLDVPMDGRAEGVPADAPQWLKPYLAAAIRSGLTAGLEQSELDVPITGAEAAVMLQNALDLAVDQQVLETVALAEDPQWQDTCLAVMAQHGLQLNAEDGLTRAQVAELLYQVNDLAATAPGLAVIRMQQ